MDIKIFIHCDSDVSLSRRVIRDVTERGRDVISILERYNRFVRGDFNSFVKPSMKYADLIIPGGAHNPSRHSMLTLAGFGFIIENLKTYQRSLHKDEELLRQKRTTDILRSIVVPSGEVKRTFATGVHYELDLNNSHSSLMLEGIFLKFTKPFFQ